MKKIWSLLVIGVLLLLIMPCVLAEEENTLVLPEDLKIIEEEAFCGDTSIELKRWSCPGA